MVLEIERESKDVLTEVTIMTDCIALQATSTTDIDRKFLAINKSLKINLKGWVLTFVCDFLGLLVTRSFL